MNKMLEVMKDQIYSLDSLSYINWTKKCTNLIRIIFILHSTTFAASHVVVLEDHNVMSVKSDASAEGTNDVCVCVRACVRVKDVLSEDV